MLYKFSTADFIRCQKFAQDQLETSSKTYAYRGEKNLDKMEQDIIIGKLGELMVAKYVRSCGRSCNRVDFKIYTGRNKSFDADLISDECNIHVKSQGVTSIKRYGKSWLLQKNDKITRDPSKNDFLCFTSVDLENKTVEILGFVRVKDIIKKGCLDEPRVPRYRHTKIALYFESIQEKCPVYDEL